MFNFLLCELQLILTASLKRIKKTEWRYLQEDLDMKFDRDWSDGLGAPLGNGHTEELNFFQTVSDSVTLLGFECTINSQNLIKFVGAIFEKLKINFFFLV